MMMGKSLLAIVHGHATLSAVVNISLSG